MHLIDYVKTFNLTTSHFALYHQSAPRYARLKFYKKLSSSNQSDRFIWNSATCTMKPFFSLNESFFPRPFIWAPNGLFTINRVWDIPVWIIVQKFWHENHSEISSKCYISGSICENFLIFNIFQQRIIIWKEALRQCIGSVFQ